MPPLIPYEDPDVPYEAEWLPYQSPVPEQPQAIECWVTEPDGTYIAHLDRSEESPFRAFWFGPALNEPGSGRLEYHPAAVLLAEHPAIFAFDNLVWMKFRDYTFTWIIEDEVAALDERERETEWRKVSGRGTLQLLGHRIVLPTDFDDATDDGLNPKTWDSQWRSFVNRAAGEMLWDLINETNPLVVTQVERGTIETTGADGWTQDLRFENVLEDVLKPVAEAHGDVEMVGRTFSYYNQLGTDRSEEVIFQEGVDIVRVRHERSVRPQIDYIVGEGVGEGVFAKLATAVRATVHRMGFAAFKDATNVPLLEVLTDSALAEHSALDALSVEVNEERFKAFTDYGVGDTVRVIVPSQGIDRIARIQQIPVAEDDDQVRLQVEIAGVAPGIEQGLHEDQARTRSELGVRNRQPQGQLTIVTGSGSVVFDSTNPQAVMLDVLEDVYVMVNCKLSVAFREFAAPATAAASDAGSTSGASSATTTDAGGSATATASAIPHLHKWADFTDNTPQATTRRDYQTINEAITIESIAGGDLFTFEETGHEHPVEIDDHDHQMPHDHPIDPHEHELTYGIFLETMPGSIDVIVAIEKWDGSAWDLVVSLSGLTELVEQVDVSAYVTGPGLWRFSFESDAGQPQGGRLAADVAIAAKGAIKSA